MSKKDRIIGVVILTMIMVFVYQKHVIDDYDLQTQELTLRLKGSEVAAVSVDGRTLKTIDSQGKVTSVVLPKTGTVRIGIDKTGQTTLVKPSPFQRAYHLGLEGNIDSVQPSLGMQWLRLGNYGTSVSVSEKGISLSGERDLYDIVPFLNNSFLGLFFRTDSTFGIKLGVYL